MNAVAETVRITRTLDVILLRWIVWYWMLPFNL